MPLPRPFPWALVILAIIFLAWMYCLINAFTSWMVVPDPLAMRLRRLPLRMAWLRRSSGVSALMMASI